MSNGRCGKEGLRAERPGDSRARAMTSISTRASRGSRAAWMVDRAGAGDANMSAYTSFIAAKSFMSARNTVVFTTCSKPAPAASSTRRRLAKTCRSARRYRRPRAAPCADPAGSALNRTRHPIRRSLPESTARSPWAPGRSLPPSRMDRYAALTTLFDRRQRVQTRMPAHAAVHHRPHRLQVGLEPPGPHVVGVADGPADDRTLVADFAALCHRSFLGSCAWLRSSAGCRDRAQTSDYSRSSQSGGRISPAGAAAELLQPARTRYWRRAEHAAHHVEIVDTPGAGRRRHRPGAAFDRAKRRRGVTLEGSPAALTLELDDGCPKLRPKPFGRQ